MRKAQGLPVNMIVLTALALLVLVVVGAFFISGFGQASSSVTIVNATQAQCQGICQSIASLAYNYDTCAGYDAGTSAYITTTVTSTVKAKEYACKCESFGACTVTLRNGASCTISRSTFTATGVNPSELFGTATGETCYGLI